MRLAKERQTVKSEIVGSDVPTLAKGVAFRLPTVEVRRQRIDTWLHVVAEQLAPLRVQRLSEEREREKSRMHTSRASYLRHPSQQTNRHKKQNVATPNGSDTELCVTTYLLHDV